MKKVFLYLILGIILSSFTYADDLCTNLEHGYSFDSGNANDEIGNNDGIIYGAVNTNTACKNNQCYYFDGSNDWIFLQNYSVVNDFTLCMYINSSSIDNFDNLFHTHYTTNDKGIRIEEYATNNLRMGFNNVDVFNQIIINGGGQWTPNTLKLFCMNYENDTANLTVFIDGISQVSSIETSNPLSWDNISLGRGWYSSNSSRYWDGYIDEVLFWGRKLSDSEIIDNVYNSGTGNFSILTTCNTTGIFPSLTINTNLVNGTQNYKNFTLPIYYNGTYSDTDGVFNCSLYVKGLLNDTHLDKNLSDIHLFNFSFGEIEGWYNFSIYCENSDVNATSEIYWYNVDTDVPIISSSFINNSIYLVGEVVQFEVNFSDLNLHAYNISWINSNGNILENIFIENLTLNSYVNISSNTVNSIGNYSINAETWDSHTISIIPDYNWEKVNGTFNNVTYKGISFNNGAILLQSFDYALIDDFTLYKDTDRYIMEYNFSSTGHYDIYLSGNKNVQYLPNSIFEGHFVLGNNHWIDFISNDIDNLTIVYKPNYEAWKIGFDVINTQVIFNSIGDLNYVSETYFFTVVNPDTFLLQQILNEERIQSEAVNMIPHIILFIFGCILFLLNNIKFKEIMIDIISMTIFGYLALINVSNYWFHRINFVFVIINIITSFKTVSYQRKLKK